MKDIAPIAVFLLAVSAFAIGQFAILRFKRDQTEDQLRDQVYALKKEIERLEILLRLKG